MKSQVFLLRTPIKHFKNYFSFLNRMLNEYAQSLREWREIEQRYKSLLTQIGEGEIPPEEELLVFLLDMKKYWPNMNAVEQRHDFRTIMPQVCHWIDFFYRRDGRNPVIGGAFEGKGTFGLNEILDPRVRGEKPILTLDRVEAMAEEVHKRYIAEIPDGI